MNPKEAIKIVKKTLELDVKSNLHLTPMLWGGAGVGKSSIVKEVGEELGYEVREIRLSTLSPVDVRGVPYVDDNKISIDTLETVNKLITKLYDISTRSNGTLSIPNTESLKNKLQSLKSELEGTTLESRFRFIPPEFMPTGTEEKPVLLFFDEINTAVASNQVVAYEIALDRKMGGHPLPEGTAVIMAGNRMKDRGATYEMPMPLSNRLIHVEVTAEIDQYIEYGMEHNFHEGVLAFLKTKPDMLEVAPSAGNWAFPTPRTWEMTSIILNDADEHNLNVNDTKKLVSSIIGSGATAELFAFLTLKEELPDLDKVLNTGESWTHDRQDILYFYVITLSSRLLKMINNDKLKDKYTEKIDNYINAVDELSSEMQALAINCVISDKKMMLYMGKNRKLMNSIRKVLK